ncbi:AsmA family protein [Cellvibrio mixtus]|uniref:AsmA family protein n=1 Tax=Cellvibrio mixtus TaxID=39650 RepID=UPI000587844D|nr:AsmA family protein [Cellvibrio mixtus]
MKILLKSLAVLLLLIVLAVFALVFLVDANRFKPRIEALAKDQGVALQIKGDLGWDLWPSIGVAVNDVHVAPLAEPNQAIASLQQASLLLKLIPLFSGNFQVDHIAVDGLKLNLKRDQTGKGNWEAFNKPATTTTPPASVADAESNLSLDIQHISLTNASLAFADAQAGSAINLRDINLTMSGVNLRAEPFAVDLGFVLEQVQANTEKLTLAGKLNAGLSVDQSMNTLRLTDGQLQLDLSSKEAATLALTYALTVTDLKNNPAYQGQITLKDTSLQKLLGAFGIELQTTRRDALGKFSLSADINGDTAKVKLENLKLVLDETTFNGSAAINNFETGAIRASLTGDTFNLDDYLPPPVKDEPATTAAPVPAQDTPLPVDSLRTLNLNIKLALKKLIVNKIPLENVDAKVLAKNGMIEQSLSATAFSGKITTKGQLDARGQQSQLQFDAGVEGLELAPLLKTMEMDSKFGLQGAIQARAIGSSQGNSTNALFKALRANANFSGAQVRVSPINLEQQFCKLVNLVNKAEDPATAWNEYTELTELSGSVKWRDQIITIDTFKAGVEKLQLGSTGKINLASDEYDIFLPLKLVKGKADTVTAEQVAVTTSANGCSVGSYYWLERGLELLRCKGSLDEINPLHDCRPDKDMLVQLTKDFAVYKLKEKHGAKFDAKKQELEQKLDDRKQEAKQKIEDKKQQLLDKLQQRLNRGAASSVAAPAVEPSASTPAAATEAAPEPVTAPE